ncbi:MAG: prepilin peptidase [Novosphingobium sp.]
MQGGIISYGLLAGLAIALVWAAYTDLKRRQIDNGLNLAIAAAAPLYWWASGMTPIAAAWQLGLALLVFAVCAVLFALRQMGGGDVKLLSALALWIAPGDFTRLCVIMALVGAALSVLAGVRNMRRDDSRATGTALAWAAAGVWILLSAYVLFVMAGGQPPRLGEAFVRVAGPAAAAWLAGLTLLAVLGATAVGTLQIVRRQATRLPIPYGVAIALAGLWLIAIGDVPALQVAV